jgi:hypothetical protein
VPVIFNYIAFVINLLGFAIAIGLAALFDRLEPNAICFLAGLAISMLDIGYRLRLGERRLFHPEHGGHIYFVPSWIIGLLITSMALALELLTLRRG